GLGGLGKKSSKATVAIDARIVNIGTGEILAVAQGKGESKRSGLTLAGAGGGGGGVLGGVLDMSSSDFGSTILGEATRAAVTDLVTALAAAAPKIPETIAAITALVADVTGSELIINVGTAAGPFTWTGYSFTGTEHFRYDAFANFGGQAQSGFYEVDATPAGNGRVQLRIQGRMGKDAFSMTTTLAPNEAIPLAQMAKLGPTGIALFSDYEQMFTGHQWQMGEGWRGRSVAFKA